jgi:hypothetical protein
MRTLFHIVFGAVGGFALGILTPIAMAAIFGLLDPKGMQQGGGTPFAIMIIVTAPLGAVWGAFWGLRRAHPPSEFVKQGPKKSLEEFTARFAAYSPDDQRLAISRVLPVWLDEFQRSMKMRFVVTVVLIWMIATGFVMLVPVLSFYLLRIIFVVAEMGRTIDTVRGHWGNGVIAQQGPLPLTLRLYYRARGIWA